MAATMFFHTLSDQEKLHFINEDPDMFAQGIFETPSEITPDEVNAGLYEIAKNDPRRSNYAFCIGHTLGRELARKNAKVAEGKGEENV
jgi:hypothetical protein